METFYTLDEIAEYMKMSRDTIKKEIDRGHLKAIKLSGRWRISESALNEWLENGAKNVKKGRPRKNQPRDPDQKDPDQKGENGKGENGNEG